jgi:predicted O-methyltransferase YrrM
MDIVDPKLEAFLHDLQPSKDPLVLEMEARAARENFPIIGPLVGRFVHQMALIIGARDVFEMGSGFGYSTWWFAQAVGQSGRVVHTEGSAERSAEARKYLERAHLQSRVTFEVGDALETIKKYPGPFDIVFIDVDKNGYPQALELARSRVRAGGLLITDNVLWSGRVLDANSDDAATRGVQRYDTDVFAAPDLYTTIVPLRDGVAVSLKLGARTPSGSWPQQRNPSGTYSQMGGSSSKEDKGKKR